MPQRTPQDKEAVSTAFWFCKWTFYGTILAAFGIPALAGGGQALLNSFDRQGDLWAQDIMENYFTIVGGGAAITASLFVVAAGAAVMSHEHDDDH